jgi:hypothetical protein
MSTSENSLKAKFAETPERELRHNGVLRSSTFTFTYFTMLDEWLWSRFIADSLGPVSMPAGKEPQRRGEDSLWATHEEEHNEP